MELIAETVTYLSKSQIQYSAIETQEPNAMQENSVPLPKHKGLDFMSRV